MIKSLKEKIILAMPIEKEFRAIGIANIIFPNLARIDSEGRKFNRGCATVARILRKIKGIQEKPYGTFYAHKEYFDDNN